MMKAPLLFFAQRSLYFCAFVRSFPVKKTAPHLNAGQVLENYGGELHSGGLAQGHVMFLGFLVIVEGCHDFVHRSLLLNLILIILLVV